MRVLFSVLIVISFMQAAGPNRVATFDRALWGESVEGERGFDKASRYELASYIRVISDLDLPTLQSVQKFTGIKKVDLKSVTTWMRLAKIYLVKNFIKAQQSCINEKGLCKKVSSFYEASQLAKTFKPEVSKQAWQKASLRFFNYYLYEQIRLAALFPRISSEIFRHDCTEEQGYHYEDREFLLTFDDGPKLSKTKPLIEFMNRRKINGIFFVLGENLEKSLNVHGKERIKSLYKGQCVGSHGYIHKPHPKLKNWASLYAKTRKLIVENELQGFDDERIWFRPPYGQRTKAMVNALKGLYDRVMLWNIDSQDWNRKLSVKAIENRVKTLMFVHRKGIILFHDIHSKALKGLESLNVLRKNRAIKWMDCTNVLP